MDDEEESNDDSVINNGEILDDATLEAFLDEWRPFIRKFRLTQSPLLWPSTTTLSNATVFALLVRSGSRRDSDVHRSRCSKQYHMIRRLTSRRAFDIGFG